MRNLLRSLDFFPYSYKPPMFGDSCYKTVHGGVISIIAMVMAAIAFLLFGQDFIYKQNPFSFSQRVRIPKDKPISIPFDNKSISFMFKFEDTEAVNFKEEDVFLHTTAVYYEFKNYGGNRFKLEKKRRFKTAPCVETTNTQNPNNASVDLSKWTCVDFDDYEQRYKEKAILTGNWTDSNTIKSIDIYFHTCKFDFDSNDFDLSTCAKYDKIERLTTENAYYLSFLMPKVNFDIQNYEKPLVYFYNYFWYKLNPNVGSFKRIHFDYLELKDDRGWILEELSFKSGLSIHERTEDVFPITKHEVDKGNTLYSKVLFYLNDASVVHFRSYVKIQQVVANIGGILKIITIMFRFSSNLVGSKLFLAEMVSKFYCFDQTNKELMLKAVFNSDDSQRSVGSVKSFKHKSIKSVIGRCSSLKVALNLIVGYEKAFFSDIWNKGRKIEKEIDIMKQIDSYLENKDKVVPLLKKQF